jgi:hypothetical protein
MYDKPDVNTDEEYHRRLTTAQLLYELEQHQLPSHRKMFSAQSLDTRIRLISKILVERHAYPSGQSNTSSKRTSNTG